MNNITLYSFQAEMLVSLEEKGQAAKKYIESRFQSEDSFTFRVFDDDQLVGLLR